ncbi:prostaglandin G/H synthase 2-like [Metopolophium dirhodum]|uniref:prostaglandin G/H synthase 2-like n=1 Tax=Metopolophium dirhodum TaxID=44670 RepID=UPI00298F83EF|nr:prostaglandin G/H synthase 2-like [Metopolophium dirhodum]
MRSFSGGKLKTREINYKHFVTNHAFAPYSDVYIKALTKGISIDRMIARQFTRIETLSTGTMLHVLSILWVREHNRVCDQLSQKWPLWTHKQLYNKARKIIIGQMMNIMMTEIINVELRPEVYHHRMENIRCSSKPIELYLTMAVSNLPEKLQYSSTNLTPYSNTSRVSEADLKDSLQLMMSSKMRIVKAHDDGPLTERLTKTLMTLSREQCLQGFNNYRRRLGLPAYNSFFDPTGNVETATELEKLYSTVEKVELLTGVLTEKSSSGVLPTAKVLSNSFIINAILTNSLTTKQLWTPDTFGGVEFFKLVKSTSLESLVCRNVDNCDELKNHRYAK